MNRTMIMINRFVLSTVFVVLFNNVRTVFGANVKASTNQPEQWQNELVKWLESKPNGYYNPKIQWQKTPSMGNSYNMHAIEDIPKNETLMVIPPSALITPNDDTEDECLTVKTMIQEYEKGPESEYYPYLRYLFSGHEGGTTPGLLPTTWSQPAKDVLRKIVNRDLMPRRFEKPTVFEECEELIPESDIEKMSTEEKQRYQDAYIYWLSRSWLDKMVPILDMINHRNGKWLNVESTSAHQGTDIRVYALRDIKKGEQLYNTYNECMEETCQFGRIKYDYVTQHIFMDYGFVEAYPRRWIFNVDEDGRERYPDDFLVVEIDLDENDKHVFDWHYLTPTQEQLEWIEKQYARLKSLDNFVNDEVAKLSSEHEKNTLMDFLNGYKEAFQLALDHKDDAVSTKTTIFDEDEDGDEL